MSAEEFRSAMIQKVRAFDSWAYKDQLANPAEYVDYSFDDWMDLFSEHMKND